MLRPGRLHQPDCHTRFVIMTCRGSGTSEFMITNGKRGGHMPTMTTPASHAAGALLPVAGAGRRAELPSGYSVWRTLSAARVSCPPCRAGPISGAAPTRTSSSVG